MGFIGKFGNAINCEQAKLFLFSAQPFVITAH
jgi:hypothetical protein